MGDNGRNFGLQYRGDCLPKIKVKQYNDFITLSITAGIDSYM